MKNSSLEQKKSIGLYDIVYYGKTNTYPEVVRESFLQCGTANQCRNILSDFLAGDGFLDTVFAAKIVNSSGQTWSDILDFCAFELATFNGFALHLKRSLFGNIEEVTPVPFQYCRITNNLCQIAASDNWHGEGIDFTMMPDPAYYERWGFEKPISSFHDLGAKRGVIYYFAQGTNLQKPYTESPAHPVLKEIEADIAINQYTLSGANNNFSATMLMEIVGNLGAKERDALQMQINAATGPNAAGKVVVIDGGMRSESGEMITSYKLTPIETPNLDKLYIAQSERITNAIIRNFGIPATLLNMAQGSNLQGNADAIKVAYQYMNNKTRKDRANLARRLSEIAGFNLEIKNKSYYE